MRSRSNPPAKADRIPASTVTHGTILILGGFLIGMGAVDLAAAEIRNYVYLAGTFGVVAWCGLVHVAKRRRQQAAAHAEELAASRMQTRVGRHVASTSRTGRRTRIHTTEAPASQHVPVVINARGPKHGVRERVGRGR